MTEGSAYDKYTWLEIKNLSKRDRIAIIPIGAIEEHGHHLPLDTDNVLVWEVCSEAVRLAPNDMLLLPLIPYGSCPMTIDYPGTISIEGETLANYLYDVLKSLARHGFLKVLIVNGHGGNRFIVEMIARKANSELGIACAAVAYWNLISKEIQERRESEIGGIFHACEMETSFYLHINSSQVQMEKAEKDMNHPVTQFFGLDFMKPGGTYFTPMFSKFSKTGAVGDPTLATSEKGKKWLTEVAQRLVELVREFKKMPQW
jgi:creatinine amidohydrolase